MNSHENVLSFMDLLDLDEDLIDSRLKSIISRENYTNKHLISAIQLLEYKQLLNLQEECDCENDFEYEFAVKLIRELQEETIENVCKIVGIVLGLNESTLENKSEHLLQQILSSIDSLVMNMGEDIEESMESNKIIAYLKLSESVLGTVIKICRKLYIPFLEVPIRNILVASDEKLKNHFLTNTVPKLFKGVEGFNILDIMWSHMKQLQDESNYIALNILSSLSDYYLPAVDENGKMILETNVIYECEFWNYIFNGLLSKDPAIRKISVYLAKRALDCVILQKKDICLKSSECVIFKWNHNDKKNLKAMWDNFFILMDSLEEKQSNIVLPSLQLFALIKPLENWLNCAFNIGLTHDSTQVRLKSLQYRLEIKLNSQSEAILLLEAVNDINIFDNYTECEELERNICEFMANKKVFMHIFNAIPKIKWSPVPLFYITKILANTLFKNVIKLSSNDSQAVLNILKVPCNHLILRQAASVNISNFTGNCCPYLHWKNYVYIHSHMQVEILLNHDTNNSFVSLIKSLKIIETDLREFFKLILETHLHIDFGLIYLQSHDQDVAIFTDLLNEMANKVKDIISRQYSDKIECINDVIFITHLFYKTCNKESPLFGTINTTLSRQYKTILLFASSLLSSNSLITIKEMKLLATGIGYMSAELNKENTTEELLNLYKTCLIFIKDNNSILEIRVLCLFLIHSLSTNQILLSNFEHEMLKLEMLLETTRVSEYKESSGKLRNVLYEKSCEIVYMLLRQSGNIEKYAGDVAQYVENIIECGGYGCLSHCLKIMTMILPFIIEKQKFDVVQFVNKMWKEIEELKSSNQYNPCIEEFIHFITHDELLKRSTYNNIIILYCLKIVEYGSLRVTPLFYLTNKLNSKDVTQEYGQIIYVVCEILLYSPVPRKDQRIIDNLAIQVLQQPKYKLISKNTHFNFHVQYLAILVLSKITQPDILLTVETFIMNKIDEAFRNKQRYHGHSQSHRSLLTALQHLLLIILLKPNNESKILDWMIKLLQRLPHQPSVRICLEWYISLYLVFRKTKLNEEVFNILENLPITSQFMIMYWTMKHKILNGTSSIEETEFVMDVLLSYAMGQNFNIRLHAQYLAAELFKICKNNTPKYTYTIQVIEKTFIESAKDKQFLKLRQDYFVNDFDIVRDLTPSVIYYFLPKYCEMNNNELVDVAFVRDIFSDVNENINALDLCDDFHKDWHANHRSDEDVFSLNINKDVVNKVSDDVESIGTIQKKYIPWKNMSDVNIYETGKKRDNPSELIVVASLIDKLPNLGGMARTGEVFGVNTYVVDSLRHLQDRQFQGLSVSAERWINVEEVRPGQPLKEYLLKMKAEGYSVVAAEQTSSSCKLQAFRFPKKTLLLLGHEKEGIPCDLLPMMDYCVEIPQQGFVRSLNVHVTAAIFIWEYTRQNIL